jgi:hypothetical protein
MAVAKKRTKMKRTQISLMPEDYDKALRMAQARRSSLSQVVRDLLRGAPEQDEKHFDPLRGLIGIADGGPADGSVDHDRYIYGPDIR